MINRRLILITCVLALLGQTVCSGSAVPTANPTRQAASSVTSIPETATPASASSPSVEKLAEPGVRNPSWSADGKSVFFSQFPKGSCNPCDTKWWQLDVSSGQRTQLKTPPAIEARNDYVPILALTSGSVRGYQISPDQQRVVYLRQPEGYVTPTPSGRMQTIPLEIWIANTNGSHAMKLWESHGMCDFIADVQWFSNGQHVLIECAWGSGLHTRLVAKMDGSETISFEQWMGLTSKELITTYIMGRIPSALMSPDEKRVAFNQNSGQLWMGFPGVSSPEKISEIGFDLRWSPDSQRLYFLTLTARDAQEAPSLMVYDVRSKSSQLVLNKSIFAGIDTAIATAHAPFEWSISPSEDAILVLAPDQNNLWLVHLPR